MQLCSSITYLFLVCIDWKHYWSLQFRVCLCNLVRCNVREQIHYMMLTYMMWSCLKEFAQKRVHKGKSHGGKRRCPWVAVVAAIFAELLLWGESIRIEVSFRHLRRWGAGCSSLLPPLQVLAASPFTAVPGPRRFGLEGRDVSQGAGFTIEVVGCLK